MQILKNKSQITVKNLKAEDCDYKGHRIGYDKKEGLYFIGSHFNPGIDQYFDTIKEMKLIF